MNAEVGQDLFKAAHILKSGGIVSIPTETVYGLAANAFSRNAIMKVFKAKNRPSFDPLITHVKSPSDLLELATSVPLGSHKLIDEYWPGPLTLILQKTKLIDDLITSGLPNAGFRMPRHPLTLQLLELLPFPLVAPSANPFGYISPTSPEHVSQQMGNKIDYILDGGSCQIGIESTIVRFENDMPQILRHGAITQIEIEKVLNQPTDQETQLKIIAPGMHTSHYAPTKPLILGDINTLREAYKDQRIGILSFELKYSDSTTFVLSKKGNVDEAAKHLFEGLHWLETLDIDLILGELVPNKGIGRAINDRLTRASKKIE